MRAATPVNVSTVARSFSPRLQWRSPATLTLAKAQRYATQPDHLPTRIGSYSTNGTPFTLQERSD